MRIVIGRSRSGKTAHILQEIAQAAERRAGRQYLIVPELFSHAYERRLAAATDGHAARTAEVLSFTRLSGRIFAEGGRPRADHAYGRRPPADSARGGAPVCRPVWKSIRR